MKKMPCLFQRDFTEKQRPVLLNLVTPGCEWVLEGEGIPTRKWDGTSVLVQNGVLYSRLDCKNGKTPPAGAIPCDPEPDPVTGHWPHWICSDRPEDKWIREALVNTPGPLVDGTYEACGPKIGSNHEGLPMHVLKKHGDELVNLDGFKRGFEAFKLVLTVTAVEGIVFHHPDGRMCKIRRDDYGLPWPAK
jgi:hypothetical protein